ncbi:hypothetical protein CC86DRAFT_300066 [Ophiobolus disseminans]|uniref:DUF8035 domain-containing protein n=1 Tax=Ophiobolus disseminans TaxID=1469910 RepID=A0A6A6ZPU4_9PLEO|nr:hypothetical protein CC86DRAFT_300066 [Ophiobolus disseminans]
MLSSVLLPSQPTGLRNTHTQSGGVTPARRNSLSTAPAVQTAKVQLRLSTIPSDSTMYKRASSPPSRRYSANPARSSTGTFADPYYDYSLYPRPSSPRSSADRIPAGSHHSSAYYTPSTTSSRTTMPSSYTTASSGRPRRNTGELTRPTASTTSMPIRTPYTPHGHLDRPSSPLAQSWDKRGDTYITQGPSRAQHKKIYSVDDSSHSTQLVAETEPARHRDTADRGYGGVTSGGRTYHSNSKPPARLTDLNDDGYSYTDPASMYRDTEPAWRRPRAGSLERTSRPTSMIVDRAPRTSARELGPPPSQRGFDKINQNSIPRSHARSSSIDRPHRRSSSIDKSRDASKYDLYPEAAPSRASSTRHHTPAIHQEPRRDTYHDTYERRDVENRRHNPVERLPDPQVSSRGFGIAPGNPALVHDQHAVDRQPIWNPHEPAPARSEDYGSQYHSSHRADARMPEPPRGTREREVAPPAAYDSYDKHDKRPREREGSTGFVPAVAGAATGVAATLGAAGYMKSREKERDERNSSEERERERERERRRAYDERDSRDKVDDRRDRRADDREEKRERRTEERRDVAPAAPAYAPPPEADRKPRELRYEDEERDRSTRKGSSEGSGDERPRHYVDRDVERRREAPPPPKEAALDPDEEYRRRVQQEAERSSRSTRDRDQGDSDRERERRRRKDDRDGERVPEERSRASPPSASREAPSSRYDERSSSLYDANLVQEPEAFDKLQADQPNPNKSVTIVTPPKEPQPAVKGILRRPTEKFPEEPEPIREGVAPHKDALKGKDIPIGARWTRIDRRLVNPQALEEAKERFEERMDCVIVLRVLTKQEIQKLADRTKKIRERREDEYDDRDRDDRDKRSHRDDRDSKDDEDRERDRGRDRDRERRRRYDDEESEYDDLGRERERPKMLEPAR